MKTTVTIVVEQLEGDNQKLKMNVEPPLNEQNIMTDPTAVTANRLLTYIQAGMSEEYETVNKESTDEG